MGVTLCVAPFRKTYEKERKRIQKMERYELDGIHMGDYLSIGTGAQSVWAGGAEIGRQLSYNDGLEKIEGEVHFRYGTIMKDTLLQQVFEEAYR